MKRFGKWALVVLGVLVVAWVAGNLLLEVQLPKRPDRALFPDPLDPEVSLREAFDSLPHEEGDRAHLRLLDDNSQAWVERWRLLAGARKHLDISYFILKQDVFGMAFLGHLVQKAHEGVEIRILLDAMGTRMSRSFRGNDYLDALVNTEKIAVKMYRPVSFRYLDAFLTLNPVAIMISDHDKILLADGKRGLIGGRNISEEYFTPPEDEPTAFLDTDLVLFGPDTGAALEAAFKVQFDGGEAHDVEREEVDLEDSTADLLLAYRVMDAWLRGEPVPPETEAKIRERDLPWLDEMRKAPNLRGMLQAPEPPPEWAEVEVRVIDSGCRLMKSDDYITRSLIRMVRSARREIFIQSPYMVLPKEAADVLEEAGERGVRITLLTNSPLSSDNPMSQGVFLEQWPELLARVPTMRIFVRGDRHNLHGKLAVFDRQLVLVGTYNLDPMSMVLNSELVAAAWSEPFAKEILKSRDQLIEQGTPRIYQYRILRGEKGDPLRDRDGKVRVDFGPDHHIEPDQMVWVKRYQNLFHWIWELAGESPFL
jgi:phosphatidylserine/phosphatidylglycerophosphate/cardiolipin synthase-like enzyme